MGRDERPIQEAIAEFVSSVKDTSVMMHSKPRLVHQQAQLGMEMWGQTNYVEMFYASEYQEVGNEYDWHNKKTIKVNIVFNDMFVDIEVSGIKYDPEVLPILDTFLKENNIQIVLPEEPKLSKEDEAKAKAVIGQLMGQRNREVRDHFNIEGIFIYQENIVKECIMAIDNQLNDYTPEGMI